MKKPCVQCEKECDIEPIQLGDAFTLTYLRACSPECMFLIAWDYFYEIGHHKDFRNKLHDLQNEEDKKLCQEFIEATSKMFLENFKKHLQANPKMLSTPVPEEFLNMFKDVPKIPVSSGCTMRFTRPCKEQKIVWAKEHVERVKEELKEAIEDLEKYENEL